QAQVDEIARRTGLNDLRFDADLVADPGREVQSLHDAQGRITGWLRPVYDLFVARLGIPAPRWRTAPIEPGRSS
ncbi:MAG: hypothetical protein ACHQQP_09735, partial [Gemmatimonadales bacterium]